MSTQDGGASGDQSGGDSSSQDDGQQGSAPKPEFVSKADHERALKDMKQYKEKLRSLEQEREKAKEAEMRKNSEWEALAKKKEEEAQAERAEKESLKKAYLNDRKYSALREHAVKLGLRQEALSDLDMLDLDDIEVENANGKVKVLGADRYAEKLKALKPHWFGSKQAPNVDTTDLRVNAPGSVTLNQLREAEKKAKKTGDSSEYLALHKKYKSQARK